MSGLYFLAMLIGIGWLCVWSVLPQPWTGGWWWPFDIRGDANEAALAPKHGSGRKQSVIRRTRPRAGVEDRQGR